MGRRKNDTRILYIVAAVVVLWLAWSHGFLAGVMPGSVVGGEEAETIPVTKKIQFSVIDAWKGQAIAGATIEVWDGDTIKETLTTDTTGQAVTANMYRSGDRIYVHVVGPDGAELWKDITVPEMSQADAEALQVIPIAIDFYNLGTYTIQLMDSNGNIYTNGQVISVTDLPSPVLTLTVTIYNTEDDSGFMESYNPVLQEERAAYLIMTATGTGFDKLSVNGFSYTKDTATSLVYWNKVPDSSLVRDKLGNTYKSTGTYSYTITIDTSALADGDQVTLQFNLLLLADGNLYLQKNIWSSETPITAATFSITLQYPAVAGS